MRSLLPPCLAAVLAGSLIVAVANAQTNRLDRQEPELVIEGNGRMGACDYLTFTDDGKQLLAVGDDKVVRIWDYVEGKLRPAEQSVLRWSVWREQRGSIYALALSPDVDNKLVAIGGLGALTSTVTILDRTTGKIVRTTTPLMSGMNFNAVWAVAFSPSGDKLAFGTGDGSVFVWDFKSKSKEQWCGQHVPASTAKGINTVRLVRFLDDDHLLSVADDGTAKEWDVSRTPVRVRERPLFAKGSLSLFQVMVSPDGKWLAAATKGPVVYVRSLDGTAARDIALEKGAFPRTIAFDRRNKDRLAVSVGTLVPGSKFHVEANDTLRYYQMTDGEPTFSKGPPHTYRAEGLAFHPTANFLAVAGGDNHEVTLWNLDRPKQAASVMRGAGNCLWGVALSANGEQVAFRDQRDAASPDPNARGKGDWRVFDLALRKWREGADFKPVEQLTEADGWTIQPDPTDPAEWNAVSPKKKSFRLPRFSKQENMPRCFTFIRKNDKTPTRVAVGHYWGLSLYELTDEGARRTRVFAGHQGEVMALAVSADQSWLVSAANDQTLAAWNLGDVFPSHPLLGAKFDAVTVPGERDRLVVKKVDVGSPTWEAGLLDNDEIISYRYNAAKEQGGPAEWFDALKNPEPGRENYFAVRRGGHPLKAADRSRLGLMGGCTTDCIEGRVVAMKTTARHRPLWRFFPTRDGEWVLWMWRNSYYDCSTKGDSYIGWHLNSAEPTGEPTFYRAEQFKKILERSDVIDKLLQTRDVKVALREVSDNPQPLSFDRFAAAPVALKLGTTAVVNQDVPVTLLATAAGTDVDYQPERAELWVNECRLENWKNVVVWEKVDGQYSRAVTIPNKKLRVGPNVITFLTYNHLGGRAEITATIDCTRPATKPRMWGLAVGVDDYKNAKDLGKGRGKLQDLTGAGNDAREFEAKWGQLGQMYADKPKVFVHLDKDAKRDDVLKALDALADKVGPDDNCVILLAGHGLFLKQETEPGEAPRSTFIFCGPDFDLTRPQETGIASEVLYGKLAAIAGHKVVILDACHSGEAAANPVRDLVPGGQGPVIMAACDRNQLSFEFPKNDKDQRRHGLFTYAILQALGDKFAEADANHNGELDAAEIYWYTRKLLPSLLKNIDQPEHAQVPILFTPAGKLVPLARPQEK